MEKSLCSRRLEILTGRKILSAKHHVGVVSTLGTGSWVNVLEPFQFKCLLGLLDSVFLTHGFVGMDLRIGHSDAYWAFAHSSLLKVYVIRNSEQEDLRIVSTRHTLPINQVHSSRHSCSR